MNNYEYTIEYLIKNRKQKIQHFSSFICNFFLNIYCVQSYNQYTQPCQYLFMYVATTYTNKKYRTNTI